MALEYNVGSDATFTIMSGGVVLGAQILTHFGYKQRTTLLRSVASDGKNRYRHLEEGWDVEMRYDRASSVIDDYFAAKEDGRYAGQKPPTVYVAANFTNPNDGSVSIYRFDGLTLKLESGGDWQGDAKVEQHVSGVASRRRKRQ